MFMGMEDFYFEIVSQVCKYMGVSCDDWRHCHCDDCVQLRRVIVKIMAKVGFTRHCITRLTGWSRSSVSEYISVRSEGVAVERLMSGIIRNLSVGEGEK